MCCYDKSMALKTHANLTRQREKITRFIQRNEKSLLAPALCQWMAEFTDLDEDPNATADGWMRAACHKQGLGVVSILQQAGVRPHSWAAVSDALGRGLEDIAFAIARLHPTLPSINRHIRGHGHILVEAARRGRTDILEAIFDKPDEQGNEIDPATRAMDVLYCLAEQRPEHTRGDLHAVVEFLVGRGADPCAGNELGRSVWDRSPVAYHAAHAANLAVLMALDAHGANLRQEQASDAHMPHPYANVQMAVIHAIGDTYYKQKKINRQQWECLGYLADRGVLLDPLGTQDLMRRLPGNVAPWERERLLEIAKRARVVQEHETLDAATQVRAAAGRPRL